jgi:hypothetical protein
MTDIRIIYLRILDSDTFIIPFVLVRSFDLI